MRMKLVTSTLAFLLLLPSLFAGGSSPAVKIAVAPKYPTLTLAGRVYGVVKVRVTIAPSGSVEDAQVTDGHPMLREAAVFAARQWRFERSSLDKRAAMLRFSFVILPETSKVKSQTIFLPPTGFEIQERPAPPTLEDQDGDPGPDPHPTSTT